MLGQKAIDRERKRKEELINSDEETNEEPSEQRKVVEPPRQ